MERFLLQIKSLDFGGFISLYQLGQRDPGVEYLYLFFARYVILVFFLTFIYLIWNKKINALICSFIAMALAGLIDLIIYLVWKRPRPFIAHANLVSAQTDQNVVDAGSFPSSHTYIAFAIATSVFLYGHKRLGTLLFILAVLIAMSRIGAGLHYPSDVIAGALLGIASGIVSYLWVHHREHNWETPESAE